MCTLAILYRVARNTPILLAANREEYLSRPTQYPKIQPGAPRVVCGIDRQAGGTWLGVNQHGLLVTMTNRPKALAPLEPRSRGLLCRDLLDRRHARDAVAAAVKETLRRRLCGGQLPLCRRQIRRGGLCRQPHPGRRVDSRLTHPDQRRPGRSQRRTPPVPSPHAHAAHSRFGGDVPGRCQPGLLAEAERRRPSRRGADRRRLRHGLFDALGAVAQDPAFHLSVQPRPALGNSLRRPLRPAPPGPFRRPRPQGGAATASRRIMPRARSRPRPPRAAAASALKPSLRGTRRGGRAIRPV